jgi:hypothetical protein
MVLNDLGWDVEDQITENEDNTSTIVRHPVRARFPVNPKATALYHANCVAGTTHQIVGDVVITPDDDFGMATGGPL